jgi:lysophospholipase L1-like esterase
MNMLAHAGCAQRRPAPVRAARWFVAIAVLAAVLMLSMIASAGAWPRKPPPVTRGATYLALGDSVAFGYEESSVVPAPNYRRASNFLGYPEHLAQMLHLRVFNLACPGETSASLINDKGQSNGCENSLHTKIGYRSVFSLHVRYKGSQLVYAIRFLKAHRSVRLVSLMVGANDGFICINTTKDACVSELPNLERKIGRNVRHIVSAIRNQGHYRGQLAIVNYYSINYASALAGNEVRGINKALDAAAKPFKVVIADGFATWRRATAKAAGNSCQAGLLTQLGSPANCGVHPSYAGQALLAQALARVVRLG